MNVIMIYVPFEEMLHFEGAWRVLLLRQFFTFGNPAYINHKIIGITPPAIIPVVVHRLPVRVISVSISPIKNTGT